MDIMGLVYLDRGLKYSVGASKYKKYGENSEGVKGWDTVGRVI